MSDFAYQPILPTPVSTSDAGFRRLDCGGVEVCSHGNMKIVRVSPDALSQLAYEAFRDMAFFMPASQLDRWADIINDPDAHENERFVARTLMQNAIISAQGVLPSCQDTGVAEILGWKGAGFHTGFDDAKELSRGVWRAYSEHNLRYSMVAASSMFEEANTGSNLPAQVEIYSSGNGAYEFLFIAKGAESSNKTSITQASEAVLEDSALRKLLTEKLSGIGVAACPPYHMGIVIGGTSPEQSLRTAKLAAMGFYDSLPTEGDCAGGAFRCVKWEGEVMDIMRNLGLGAQFGGKYMALQARVIRLPRHAGSCSIAISVGCSAHRVIKGRIDPNGVWLEELDRNPARHADLVKGLQTDDVQVDLSRGMNEILAQLRPLSPGTRVRLTGPLVVARDIAHQQIKARFESTGQLPEYFKNHPVYYAGPAKTPAGMPCGSLGPTTAQRMDPYMETFMSNGACLVTVAKGNRDPGVNETCRRYKGCFLGTIGGAAAILARDHVVSSEVIDYEDLGMEAVRLINVRDMPAFVVIDSRGQSIY